MSIDHLNETESIENEAVVVRTMREGDLEAVVSIDALSSGRRRPEYFKLMFDRTVKQAAMQISLVAELDGRAVGFVIGSLFYGEYGILEPTASIDVIGVTPEVRRQRVAVKNLSARTLSDSEGYLPPLKAFCGEMLPTSRARLRVRRRKKENFMGGRFRICSREWQSS